MRFIFQYIILFFICLLLSSSAKSQLLWKISGKNLEKPSYLYGTIHLGDERVYNFGPKVLPSFNKADAFAGEMILDESAIFSMLSAMYMPGDTTLSDLLPKEKYDTLMRSLNRRMGGMEQMMIKVRPIFIAMMIGQEVEKTTTEHKFKTREPLDLFFQQEAKRLGKKLIGVETPAEQLASLNEIPLEYQAEMLYKEIIASDNDPKQSFENSTEKLIQLYQTENLDSLYSIVTQDADVLFQESILLARNYRMAERIETMILEQSTFIGVGAAHLPGPEGIIELLRKRGYKVKAL